MRKALRHHYHLFKTPIGLCGIVWETAGPAGRQSVVVYLQLPEATRQLMEQRVAEVAPGAGAAPPPPGIAGVISKIQRHLGGDPQDFRTVRVELGGASVFARQVYDVVRGIPAGLTMTYGELAQAMHRPGAARAVGQALGRNPIPLIIPCHRVLAAGGQVGGFSAPGGPVTKARLLALEGVGEEPRGQPWLRPSL